MEVCRQYILLLVRTMLYNILLTCMYVYIRMFSSKSWTVMVNVRCETFNTLKSFCCKLGVVSGFEINTTCLLFFVLPKYLIQKIMLLLIYECNLEFILR